MTTASTTNGCCRRQQQHQHARRARAASPRAPRRSWRPAAIVAGTTRTKTTSTTSTSTVRADGGRSHDGRAGDTRGAYPRPWRAALDLARLGAPCAGRERGRDPREDDGDRGAEREPCSRARSPASPMRLIAEIGSAWRASPRKPAPWSCGSNTRCAAIRMPITGPREPNSAASPTASAAPTAPEASVIAAAWTMSPRAGVRGAVGERERAGDVEGERDREDRADDDPRAAHPRQEQRAARAAGGGEITEDAGVDVLRPGGRADDRGHDEAHHREELEAVLEALEAARGVVLAGVAAVLDGR